jgi:PKD repeat protein
MTNWTTVSFEGHTIMNLPADYSWQFGDGTGGQGKNITHLFPAPGLYTVTLTTVLQDSNQCTFSSTQQIHVGDSNMIHQVYGQVFEGNFPLLHGMAMIFSTDTMPGGMPFFANCLLDSVGVYTFPYVPNGDFLIWAMPFDSLGGYLPTFYQHSLYWEQANVIHLGMAVNPYNISLIHAGNMPGGPGGINGQVNSQTLKSATAGMISMLLTDEQGNAIGFRKVSTSGAFDFSAMGYGTYYLKPELPGYPSDLVKVVLSAANPVASVTMTFTGKGITGVNDNSSAVESFTAYPNPVSDVLNLDLKLSSASNPTAQVYNFSGQMVYSQNFSLPSGANQLRLNVGVLTPGIYTLRITSPEGIRISEKIVIMR